MIPLNEIRQHFRLPDTAAAPFIALTALQQADSAWPLFTPLLQQTPRAERAAQFSRWSQWYFALLLAPMIKINLQYDWQLPVSLTQLGLRLSPEGVPMEFRLSHTGAPASVAPAAARFAALIEQQIAPVCATLAALSGLSPALLWNNAAFRLDQGMRQAAACGADIRPLQQLLARRHLAGGERSLLWQPVREGVDSTGKVQRERRMCCLRGDIAGQRLCASCPLKRRQRTGEPAWEAALCHAAEQAAV